jgi:hypothetical protein
MKRVYLSIFFLCLFTIGAQAQATAPSTGPATTPNNVSRIIYWDVLPGMNNATTNHIRTNQMPILEEQQKQGLILGYGFFGKPGTDGPGDWDLGLVVTYKNYADAIDFNPERGEKMNAIGLKHYGSDEARTKANDAAGAMRTVVRSYLVRGVTFNPMPK